MRSVGEKVKRGQTIETEDDEYVAVRIGNDVQVFLDERSRLTIHRVFVDEMTIIFTRGRIVLENRGGIPVLVETHKTENVVEKGSATFINYDFQQLVTIAPMQGSVQTRIKNINEYLLIP